MSKEYEPRIYVACLASYNNGVLHGDWIDLEGKDEDEVQEAINVILRSSQFPNVEVECPECKDGGDLWKETCPMCKATGKVSSAEEWAIHDFEGFGSIKLGEYEGISEVVELAQKLEEHGEIFEVAYDNFGDVDEAIKAVDEDFHGEHKSLEDYVQEFYEENYSDVMKNLPDALRYHIDWEGVARDWEIGGDVWTAELEDGNVAIFNNH